MPRTLEQDRTRKRKDYLANIDHYKQWDLERKNKPGGREKRMLTTARTRAKKKGLEFTLTLEDIVIPEVCPVFKVPFNLKYGSGTQPNAPSLDRIDNSKGYTQDNVAVISWRANNLKGDSNLYELKQLVNYLEDLHNGA